MLHVTTDGADWVLPPTRAVWVPAGVPHTTGASTPATLRSLCLPPDCPVRFAEPTAIAVDDLLAALIVHLARTDLPEDARTRAEAVVYDPVTPAHAGGVPGPCLRGRDGHELRPVAHARQAAGRPSSTWPAASRSRRWPGGWVTRRRARSSRSSAEPWASRPATT